MNRLKLVLLILLIVGIGIGCVSYIRVNNKYPSKEIRQFYIGDVIQFQSYEFTLKNVEMYLYDEFRDKYDYVDDVGMEQNVDIYDTHICMISLSVKNPTEEILPMPPVVYFTLEHKEEAFSTNFDLLVYESLQNYDTSKLGGSLEPGETIDLELPFTIDAFALQSFDGIKLHKEDFIYVLSLYPVKNYVCFKKI